MTKKTKQQEKLLAETFHEDWAEGAAANFARQAAASARRRRRFRGTLVVSGMAAGIAAAVMISVHSHRVLKVEQVSPKISAPAYEIISDEQLIAELRDRPLLVLPEENGAKKIVLLER